MDDGSEPNTQADSLAFLSRLGQRIRDVRHERLLSQEKLAEQCDLVQHYISQVEQGERNVSVVVLRLIARGLGVTLAVLLDGLD